MVLIMADQSMRDRLRVAYDAQAEQRDSATIQQWKIDERACFLRRLREENKGTLLEIGPGPGKDSLFFQNEGLTVTCIDLSPEMVKLCRKKGLNARLMDMADLRFAPASFDAVYALNSLLHLAKAEVSAVLGGINTIMRPTGLFYLGLYGGIDFEGTRELDNYVPKRFFSYYADEDLRRKVTEAFRIEYFTIIPLERERELHFQSLILRKK